MSGKTEVSARVKKKNGRRSWCHIPHEHRRFEEFALVDKHALIGGPTVRIANLIGDGIEFDQRLVKGGGVHPIEAFHVTPERILQILYQCLGLRLAVGWEAAQQCVKTKALNTAKQVKKKLPFQHIHSIHNPSQIVARKR